MTPTHHPTAPASGTGTARPAAPVPPPRRILARLDPDLTDSPLRRALRAAGLDSPFGIADGDPTGQENPTP